MEAVSLIKFTGISRAVGTVGEWSSFSKTHTVGTKNTKPPPAILQV